MSELKVNSIKGTGASTAAITLNSSDGTCTANITNNLGHKNIGGFQTVVIAYDQRNAWESAMGSPDWEMLFFPVENISVFPTQPV